MATAKRISGLVLLAWSACVLTGCPPGRGGTSPGPGRLAKLDAGNFVVALEQDGRRVMLNDRHEARLARREFTVVVVFPKWGGVMVNASARGELAAAVRAGRPVATVLPLPRRGLPEDLGNPRTCIFVTEQGYSYWYYLGQGKSSFDEVIQAPREFVCRRRVGHVAADNAAAARPLTELPADRLYLTFVSTAWSGNRRVEKAAEYITLVFD